MPAYHVARSIIINAPISKVRDSLINYRQWPKWSPWLIMEPESKLNFSTHQSQVGAGFDWDGELTGKGEMKLTEISENELMMALEFIKPFKSTAKVTFDLEEPRNNVTKVTWNMHSRLPFFLFWMVNKMKTYIGMDCERGLKMLKDYLETGTVLSTVKIDGTSRLNQQAYIGIKNHCRISDITKVRPENLKRLYQFMEEHDLSNDIIPFTIYETFDLVKDDTSFITAIPVDSGMQVTAPFINGQIYSSEVLMITHKGSYDHLENAWSTAMALSRAKKMKTIKSPVGMEFYLNDHTNTPSAELLTEVVLPLR